MSSPTRQILIGATLLAAMVVSGLASASQAQSQGIRRFALLVGANYGGLDRVRLQYAETDTRSMARVLTRLGGVAQNDRWLVTDPRPKDLMKAFARAQRRMESVPAGQRVEFVFYYSGHSDESGLLLGGQRFDYARIRKIIKDLPASVRVVILDSCSSGAFTRAKGGVRRQPFLVDDSTRVQGYAVITSSAANETAQESDRLGGSFFTHYLVSGLRGAADLNQDRKITLAEAYQHAFAETLARTETTRMGPQHPNYDFQLAGAGNLTLTDLRGTSALLELTPDLAGRLFIRGADGHLVAEVNKQAGTPMLIGLDPGIYRVTLETPGSIRRGSLEIRQGQRARLAAADLATIQPEETTARGDLQTGSQIQYRDRWVSFSVVPGMDGDLQVRDNFSFNLLAGYGGALSGLEISGLGAIRIGPAKGVQIAGLYNAAESFTGFELGGITNVYTDGPSWGVTISGVADIAAGEIHGFQLGGVVALARSIQGVQASVISATWDDVHGAQLGVLSYAEDVSGLQLGVIPVASGEVRGLQSGVISVTGGDLHGLQLGTINVAASGVSGAQIGVINWGTRTSGWMVGLINLAAEGADSTPIGLINILGDGEYEPTVWTDDSSMFNVGLKMGSKNTYSILGAGVAPYGANDGVYVLAGVGGHIPLRDPLWLEIDVIGQGLVENLKLHDDKGLELLSKVRASVGFQIFDWLAVYGGLSLNLLVADLREHGGPAWLRLWAVQRGDTFLDLGLGLFAGVQI